MPVPILQDPVVSGGFGNLRPPVTDGGVMSLPDDNNVLFFITPIGDEGSDIRERSDQVLKYVVKEAAERLDLQAVRADQIARPGEITAQVIEYLIGAKAAVADLTDRNANVAYELAIRHAAKKPVVMIMDRDQALPFDLTGLRTEFFKHDNTGSAHQCRDAIVEQLRAEIDGDRPSSPIFKALDVIEMRAAAGPLERSVGDLVASFQELAFEQRATSRAVEQIRESVGRRSFSQTIAHDLTNSLNRLSEILPADADAGVQEVMQAMWTAALRLANYDSHVPDFSRHQDRAVTGHIEMAGTA